MIVNLSLFGYDYEVEINARDNHHSYCTDKSTKIVVNWLSRRIFDSLSKYDVDDSMYKELQSNLQKLQNSF